MSRKIFENLTVASEASRSIWGKLATPPPPPIVGMLKSDYLFFSQKRTGYLFSAFSRSEYFFSTKCQPPPPPQNQMVVHQLRTQNGSTSLGEKIDEQETGTMLAAGQCRQGCGRIQCDIQESTATSRACKWLVQRLPSFISFSINLIFKGSTRKCTLLELLDAE